MEATPPSSDSSMAPILDAIRQQPAIESLIDMALIKIRRHGLGSARSQGGHLARTHNSYMPRFVWAGLAGSKPSPPFPIVMVGLPALARS